MDMEATLEIVNEIISRYRGDSDLVSISEIDFYNREGDMEPYRAEASVFVDGGNQIIKFENIGGSWFIK